MSDLEPVGQIIPRVFDAAADTAERAATVDALNRLAPPGPPPERDELTIHATAPEHRLAWPQQLHSRVTHAREMVQCLDLDAAIATLFELEAEIGLIERADEHVALRGRDA